MTTLLIAEHDNQTLKSSTLHTLSAAKELASQVTVLVIGWKCQDVAKQAAKLEGVKKVIQVEGEQLESQLAEDLAPIIQKIGQNFEHIFAPATVFGKNLMPRVAALLDVAQISDILAIVSHDTFKRPIYAGNAIATVQSLDPIKVITVRSTAFEACNIHEHQAHIELVKAENTSTLSLLISNDIAHSSRPELSDAKIIVSGGRGLGSKENFTLIEDLADALGGAVGASRAAVDAGFVSNDLQVGQTGKIVAPDLYIAAGISGAIQHLAGMKDSKVIVAINKDEDAPIFQIADYGYVGDVFEVLPAFESAMKQR